MRREDIALTETSDKSFDTVVANIEKNTPLNQFRVLHIHDVQATLAEKGFQMGPLKLIEICNAGFAHQALQKDMLVSLFIPCRFAVYTEGDKTKVTLGLPSMINQVLPNSNLGTLSSDVETKLKKIMQESV